MSGSDLAILDKLNFDKTSAANALGVSRQSLHQWFSKETLTKRQVKKWCKITMGKGEEKGKLSPKILHVQYIAHCDVHIASYIAPYRVHSDLMNEKSYLIGYV